MSRLRNFFQRNDSVPSASSEDEHAISAEQARKEDEAAVKEESRLTRVFEVSRQYFLQERLKGNLYVSYSFLAFGNTISCDIDGTTREEGEVVEDIGKAESELTRFERAIFNAAKRAISNMQRRAKAYRDKPYRGDITLSTSVSVTTPALGLVSFYINISATVDSVLLALERKQRSTSK
jgi:hypothetical protein